MNRLVCLLVLAIAACNPYLTQQSVAPPGRTARLDRVDGFWSLEHYRLEVSRGVALALTCYQGGPCEHMKVTSDDPAIAEVRPASLAALEAIGYGGDRAPSAAFVIVGKAAGQTRVHVAAAKGKRDVVVTVTPDPVTAAAAHATP